MIIALGKTQRKSRLESPSFRKLLRGLNRKCTSRSIFILVSVHSLWPSGTLCIYTTHDTTTKAESVIKKDLSQHSLSILCCSQSKEHYDFLLMSARKNSTNFNSVKNKVFFIPKHLFINTSHKRQKISGQTSQTHHTIHVFS